MKKRFLTYAGIAIATISLQSCVSNYVVSAPAKYKDDAKTFVINEKKLAEAREELNSIAVTDNNPQASFAMLQRAEMEEAVKASIKKSQTIDQILNEAHSYLGTPYRLGGMTRRGIDCSAFVLSVFDAAAGKDLPRVAASQAREGDRVNREELEKGDLLFFATSGGSRISHVGIVENIDDEGNVKFIHAATSKGVSISSLNESYWNARFKFAKRVINN